MKKWTLSQKCGIGAIMVLSFGLGTYDAMYIESLKKRIPELQTEDVMRGEGDEKFYVINGEKVFQTIDGVPVRNYFEKDSNSSDGSGRDDPDISRSLSESGSS